MKTYTCDNYRSVREGEEYHWRKGTDVTIESAEDAVKVFARRFAQKKYGGRRAGVHHVRLDRWAADGSCSTFEAFCGRWCDDGGMTGKNEWFTVYINED